MKFDIDPVAASSAPVPGIDSWILPEKPRLSFPLQILVFGTWLSAGLTMATLGFILKIRGFRDGKNMCPDGYAETPCLGANSTMTCMGNSAPFSGCGNAGCVLKACGSLPCTCPGSGGGQSGSTTYCSAYMKTYDCADYAYFTYDKKENTAGVTLIIVGFILILSFAAWARLKMAAYFRHKALEKQRLSRPQESIQNQMNQTL